MHLLSPNVCGHESGHSLVGDPFPQGLSRGYNQDVDQDRGSHPQAQMGKDTFLNSSGCGQDSWGCIGQLS